jgi:hypothetical protein
LGEGPDTACMCLLSAFGVGHRSRVGSSLSTSRTVMYESTFDHGMASVGPFSTAAPPPPPPWATFISSVQSIEPATRSPPVASRLRTDNILVSSSFVLTAFVFLSALQSNVVGGLNRVTARTLSARVFFPLRRSQLSDLLQVIRMPPMTNIGCFKRPSMDYIAVPVIGMRKLIPFSV